MRLLLFPGARIGRQIADERPVCPCGGSGPNRRKVRKGARFAGLGLAQHHRRRPGGRVQRCKRLKQNDQAARLAASISPRPAHCLA
jgi:hypothetical protein